MSKSVKALKAEREELLRKLSENEEATQRAIRKAEEWVSAEEARNLLAQVSDPNGTLPYSRLLPIMKTLVSLRPEPDNESDYYFTWETSKDEDSTFPTDQFSVSLERDKVEVLLNDDFDQVAHSLTPDEAELLGSRLIGAAELGRKLQEEA